MENDDAVEKETKQQFIIASVKNDSMIIT